MTILKKLNKFISVILCLTLCLSCVTVVSADSAVKRTEHADQAEQNDTAAEDEASDTVYSADDTADKTDNTAADESGGTDETTEIASEAVTAETAAEQDETSETDESDETTDESETEYSTESADESVTGGTDGTAGETETGDQVESPAAVNISTIAALDGAYELYVNFESGSDEKDGKSEANAVKTMEHAIDLAEQMHDSENKAAVDIFAMNTFNASDKAADAGTVNITWTFEEYMNVYTDTAEPYSLIEGNNTTYTNLKINNLNFYGGTLVSVSDTEAHRYIDIRLDNCNLSWTADTDGYIIDAVTPAGNNSSINVFIGGDRNTDPYSPEKGCEFHGKQLDDGTVTGGGIQLIFMNPAQSDSLDLQAAYSTFDTLKCGIRLIDKSTGEEQPYLYRKDESDRSIYDDIYFLVNDTFSSCETGINCVSGPTGEDGDINWSGAANHLTFNNCDTCIGTVLTPLTFDHIIVNAEGPETGDYTQKFAGAWGQCSDTVRFEQCEFYKCLQSFDEHTPELEFSNCIFDGQHDNPRDRQHRATLVNLTNGITAAFSDCQFKNYYDAVIANSSAINNNITKAFFTGCSFSNFQNVLEAGDYNGNGNNHTLAEIHLNAGDTNNTLSHISDCLHEHSYGRFYINSLMCLTNDTGTLHSTGRHTQWIFGPDPAKYQQQPGHVWQVFYEWNDTDPSDCTPATHDESVIMQCDIGQLVSPIYVRWKQSKLSLSQMPNDYRKYGIVRLSGSQSYDNVSTDKLRIQLNDKVFPYIAEEGIVYPCGRVSYTVSPAVSADDYAASAYASIPDYRDIFSWDMQEDDAETYTANKDRIQLNLSDYLVDIKKDPQLDSFRQRIITAETAWKQYFNDCWSGYGFKEFKYSHTINDSTGQSSGLISEFSAGTYDFMSHLYEDSAKFMTTDENNILYHYTIAAHPVFTPVPGLSITKQIQQADQLVSANSARPGDTVDYVITVKNTGGVAVNVTVEDILDKNLTYVSADSDGAYTDADRKAEWTIDALRQNESKVLKLSAKINDNVYENT